MFTGPKAPNGDTQLGRRWFKRWGRWGPKPGSIGLWRRSFLVFRGINSGMFHFLYKKSLLVDYGWLPNCKSVKVFTEFLAIRGAQQLSTNFNPPPKMLFSGAVPGPKNRGPPCAHVLVILGAPRASRATLHQAPLGQQQLKMYIAPYFLKNSSKYQTYPKLVKKFEEMKWHNPAFLRGYKRRLVAVEMAWASQTDRNQRCANHWNRHLPIAPPKGRWCEERPSFVFSIFSCGQYDIWTTNDCMCICMYIYI